MPRWIVPTFATVFLASMLAGCSGTSDSASVTPRTAAATSNQGQVLAHRNAEGRLVCPVMNVVIKSEADAKGYQDYEGKRYYFCCGVCPGKFAADPARYAKK